MIIPLTDDIIISTSRLIDQDLLNLWVDILSHPLSPHFEVGGTDYQEGDLFKILLES